MKRVIYVLSIGLLAACSAPKYTASFTNYDQVRTVAAATPTSAPSVAIDPQLLEASLNEKPIASAPAAAPVMVKKTYLQMNQQQRKEVRAQIKKDLKSLVKVKKQMGVNATQATQGMDGDLKLAAIFGAVGVVGLIIGGDVFYIIGGLAMIIGVVFFVKWLIRQ